MIIFNNLVMPNDLSKFNKSDLTDLATELDISSIKNNKMDLAIEIFNKFKKQESKNEKITTIISNKLLAGKTAVKWFNVNETLTYNNVIDILKKDYSNLFESISIPDIESLSTEPTIFGLVADSNTSEIYIRLIYKSGVKSEMYGPEINKTPIPGYATIYINFEKKILEYRGDTKKAKKIVNNVIDKINKTSNSTIVEERFGFTVEQIASSLEGELIDTVSLPDINIDDDEEKYRSVSKVLEAIDKYFNDSDIEKLESALMDINQLFDHNIDKNIMPFSSLLLSGLETIGMGSNKEIRNTPLYKYLNSNLTQTTGFIRIKVPEGNVINEYTIRVGIQTKSIFFTSDVSEKVISYVRGKLFNSK